MDIRSGNELGLDWLERRGAMMLEDTNLFRSKWFQMAHCGSLDALATLNIALPGCATLKK